MATEKCLIDISEFHEALRKYLNSSAVRKTGPVCCGMRIAIRHCIELIEGQKPVDAVEVVRCKDCKYGIWDEEEQMWECVVSAIDNDNTNNYVTFHEYNKAEHFCSYGEMRDNG